MSRKRPKSLNPIALNRPVSQAGIAADVVATLNRGGVPAELVRQGTIEAFARRQAEQLIAAAQRCKFPDVRAEMEETARAVLAGLEQMTGEAPPCERCGKSMELANTVPAVAGHPEICSYRCAECGNVVSTV
jgi:hypothetical protein